jgi:SAM-dependent methyltransferase
MLKRAVLRTLEQTHLLTTAFRFHETVTAIRAARAGVESGDGLPLPPARLRVQTAGTADSRWFIESGRVTAEIIRDAAARHDVQLDSVASMLDFGCGCGRVLRHWTDLSEVEIHGAEPSPRLAQWCAENLAFANILQSPQRPRLPYESNSFDVVYAISVFTHLSEGVQVPWAEEVARLVKPKGLLLLTTHGDRYVDRLTSAERQAYEEGCLVVRRPQASGTNLCTAFHPHAYVEGHLTAGLNILEYTTNGLGRGTPEQDLVLLRKPPL